MAQIKLGENTIETVGPLPAIGSQAKDFTLTKTDFADVTLQDVAGKTVVLNIFLSIDTGVCQASVRRFNQELNDLKDTVVLCVSADLPFAHKRFCEGEGLSNVIPLSVFRSPAFGTDYGVTITTGTLKGALSRAVVIIDPSGTVVYTEQVPAIGQEPDYEKALTAVRTIGE